MSELEKPAIALGVLVFAVLLLSGSDSRTGVAHPELERITPANQARLSGPTAVTEKTPSSASGSRQPRGFERPDHQRLARSLRGTDVDGTLAVDDDGNLIVSLGVRDFFDYFLSTVGEVPLKDVVAFMDSYARSRLPERAADQLMALLDDYMGYRRGAAELFDAPLAPVSEQSPEYYFETLEHTFDALHELRRQHLGDEVAEEFFGLEEEYGQYTLDRMAIQMDTHLDEDEKQQLTAALRSDLSDGLRHSENDKVAQAEISQRATQILDSTATAADKRTALAEFYTSEVVDRMMDHEDAKRAFQARLQEYLAAREPILADDLDPHERESRMAALRRRHFHSEQEIIWARTYEARMDR